jgi:hypothetical protein
MFTFEKLIERIETLDFNLLLEASNDFDPTRQQRGEKAENDFAFAMVNHGYYLKVANQKQEREYHFDFLVFDGPDRSTPSWTNRPENSQTKFANTVEVKQKNKIIGNNILVEFVAKDQYAGWLCSHANYIAYERGEGKEQNFVFVKMDSLREYVNDLILKHQMQDFPLFKKGLDTNKSVGASIFNSLEKYQQLGKIEFVNRYSDAIFPKVYYRKEITNSEGKSRPDGSVITFVPLNGVLDSRNTDLTFFVDKSKAKPKFKAPLRAKYPDIMKELVNSFKLIYDADDIESKQYIVDKFKSNDVAGLINDVKDALEDNETLSTDNIDRLFKFYQQNPNHVIFK